MPIELQEGFSQLVSGASRDTLRFVKRVEGTRVCQHVRIFIHYPLALVLTRTPLESCQKEARHICDQIESEQEERGIEEGAALVPEEETHAGPVGQVVEVSPELQVLYEELEGSSLSL